jgi:Electron transfer DM13
MAEFSQQASILVLLAASVSGCGSRSPASPSGPMGGQPAATPAPTPDPTLDPAPTTLRRATFESANGYTTEGGAAIVRERDSYRLELDSDFRTSQSAALEVRLCAQTQCGGADLNLGEIKAYSGMQAYDLNADGSQYRYVVIWCRAVNLPFGFGELS